MNRDSKGRFVSKNEENRKGPYVNDVENEKTSTRNLVGILFAIVITVTFLIGMVYPL